MSEKDSMIVKLSTMSRTHNKDYLLMLMDKYNVISLQQLHLNQISDFLKDIIPKKIRY